MEIPMYLERWINCGSLSIEPSETSFNEISIKLQQFSFWKIDLKMSSAKWRPLCLGLNVLIRFENAEGVSRLRQPRVGNDNINFFIRFTAPKMIIWWRHQMKTFSALLALCEGNSPVTGEFPSQRPVTRSFDVFFDLRLNNRLNKPSIRWWFETPSHSSL